ncbi:hypothetical protein ACQPXM_05995 [Kribbella sp. CA-253562]|uniref:hypothetical protein n=1 Tax=Kribbella sp. CA-253562 TaxID=3239942 RepID=UPI003D8EB1B5
MRQKRGHLDVQDEPVDAQETWLDDFAQPIEESADPVEDDGATFGAAFFGWLVASSIAILTAALLGLAGTLIGWSELAAWLEAQAGTTGPAIASALVLVVIVALAAFTGGYAAGRMVLSHGGRQGLGVWFCSLAAVLLASASAYFADRRYDLVSRVDWSTLPIVDGDWVTVGLTTLGAALLLTAVAAVAGGAAGTRYHRTFR